MKIKLLTVMSGMCLLCASALKADELDMQNGDRYFGKVESVTAKDVIMNSEILGKITLPRSKVSCLTFGTNAVALKSIIKADTAQAGHATNNYIPNTFVKIGDSNQDLEVAFRSLGAGTNFIHQIRDQMLAGSPEASSKYDQMVNDLLSGRLDMNGLRRQAQTSAEQIRELKRELGSDAGDSLDGYLQVLDQFLNETASESSGNTDASQPQTKKP